MSEKKLPPRKLHMRVPGSIRVEALNDTGYHREPDDEPIPCMKIRGMWMRRAGLKVGDCMTLEFAPGVITLRRREPPTVTTRPQPLH